MAEENPRSRTKRTNPAAHAKEPVTAARLVKLSRLPQPVIAVPKTTVVTG